jgi:hypothetical protein
VLATLVFYTGNEHSYQYFRGPPTHNAFQTGCCRQQQVVRRGILLITLHYHYRSGNESRGQNQSLLNFGCSYKQSESLEQHKEKHSRLVTTSHWLFTQTITFRPMLIFVLGMPFWDQNTIIYTIQTIQRNRMLRLMGFSVGKNTVPCESIRPP